MWLFVQITRRNDIQMGERREPKPQQVHSDILWNTKQNICRDFSWHVEANLGKYQFFKISLNQGGAGTSALELYGMNVDRCGATKHIVKVISSAKDSGDVHQFVTIMNIKPEDFLLLRGLSSLV